ncbi:NAD-dependent epimerase/dehydratase family protein [Muriicola sp. Z0-33]|uniref:NAD-dependent epimerase/dehydratase family protein n=1 Tax=Muriicola sp. Z0-33 TaxID=2816957 RepID=UPI0022374874|nr:NAD-dependent epimerase/dehydratase family protein [Muriicola sp. Z0-33]MCW5516911.1 NAD-dependent epimerase/dehydratase family protein [Muriicola sp. Z0-33]
MKRRNFTKTLAASATLMGLAPYYSCNQSAQPLNILVLGGTDFLGPAIVRAILKKGHSPTLFNRGKTNPTLFPNLPLIKGDRDKGAPSYSTLKNTQWDVVIDVWPQKSALVQEAAASLTAHTKHYVFISSVAVYKDFNDSGRAEDYQLVHLPEDKSKWDYPEEKTAAEMQVIKNFPGRHTILRPGPIKGWRDPAYDLLYWLIKLDRGENILCPGDGQDGLQFIDVNDVGAFAVLAAEKKLIGAYNCTGPTPQKLSWRSFLERAKNHLKSPSELVWSTQAKLQELNVYPWSDLPLWAPTTDDYFMEISNAKAVAAGFEYTPIEKTISDCLAWYNKQGAPDVTFGEGNEPVGMERARELEVLESLKKG